MTAIVSAVCVAIVLAPVAVWASSAPRSTAIQKVYITDPHNSAHRAAVSSTGALSVGGTVNVGNLPATQNVSGSVTTVPGLPGTPFTKTAAAPPNFTVPTGKTLVIENVSVNVDVTTGHSIYAELDFTTGGASGNVFLPLTYSYTDVGYDTYVATVPVHVYADSATTVSVFVSSPTGTTGTDFLAVSGYLV